MTTTKTLIELANTLQAANLVGANYKSINKKQSTKGIINLGVMNITGTSLIKSNADLISLI